MKDFLLETFPNPERKGCPDDKTIEALAEDRLPTDHPARMSVLVLSVMPSTGIIAWIGKNRRPQPIRALAIVVLDLSRWTAEN